MAVKVKVSQIQSNPYRDLKAFPKDAAVVQGLVVSMEKTGFWDNVLLRLLDNTFSDEKMATTELIAQRETDGYDWSKEVFELAYGHHRLDALLLSNILEVALPVKVISNDHMLKIMALENKASWGGNLLCEIETVNQVETELRSRFESFEKYVEVKKAGYESIMSKAMFSHYLTNEREVSATAIRNFLGGDKDNKNDWAKTRIEGVQSFLRLKNKGYILQEDILEFPSLSILRFASKMVSYIMEGTLVNVKDDAGAVTKVLQELDLPLYYKTRFIDEIIIGCSKDEEGNATCTVSSVEKAYGKLVNKGVNPQVGIRGGNTPFDINKAASEEVFGKVKKGDDGFEMTMEDSQVLIDEYLENEGFDEWVGVHDLKTHLEELAMKRVPGAEESEELEKTTEEELQDELIEGEKVEEVEEIVNPFETADVEGEVSFPNTIAKYVQSAAIMQTGLAQLLERADAIDIEDADLTAVTQDLLNDLALFAAIVYGKKMLTEAFTIATARRVEEEEPTKG